MIDTNEISTQMFWRMCDMGMSEPEPLATFDLTKPFLYDRRWGAFAVEPGRHQIAMALLLAWHHDLNRPHDVLEKLALKDLAAAADHWLEHIPGTALKSSVGRKVLAASPSSLNPIERRRFGEDITYL